MTHEPSRKPLWKRIIGKPESGLVLVIVVLGALLAAFAGERDAQSDIKLPQGATAARQQGVWVVTTEDQAFADRVASTLKPSDDGQLRVVVGGKAATYEAGRPRLIDGEDGAPATLRVEAGKVNRFFNLENITMLANNASGIAIMAVGMTFIIAMGGIDLSIGMVWALAAFVGIFAFKYPWEQGLPSLAVREHSWPVALGLIAAAGGLVGNLALRGRAKRGEASPGLKTFRKFSLVTGAVGGLFVFGIVLFAFKAAVYADPTRDPTPMSMPVALAVGLGVCGLTGAICGMVSGSLTVGLGVHPFIITLGMMAALEGFLFVLSGSQSLVKVPATFGDQFFKMQIAGVYPVPVFFMIATTVAGTILLNRTVLGRRTLAIGDNEKAALYAGIPVGKTKITVYMLAGLLAGLSAAVNLGYWQSASPSAGKGAELQVIAATVIGGASLSGGRGSAVGAVLGAVLIEMINNGMVMLEVDSNYNKIVMGVAIVVAVVIDQAKTRLQRRRH